MTAIDASSTQLWIKRTHVDDPKFVIGSPLAYGITYRRNWTIPANDSNVEIKNVMMENQTIDPVDRVLETQNSTKDLRNKLCLVCCSKLYMLVCVDANDDLLCNYRCSPEFRSP